MSDTGNPTAPVTSEPPRRGRRPRLGGLACPACGCRDSSVEHTMKQDAPHVRRSRCCAECGTTFSTAEIPLRRLRELERAEGMMRRITLYAAEERRLGQDTIRRPGDPTDA